MSDLLNDQGEGLYTNLTGRGMGLGLRWESMESSFGLLDAIGRLNSSSWW